MKKIINILLVGLVSFAFIACEKDFEVQRPNQDPWQSVSELELAVQAPYLMITERPWANAIGMMPLRGFGESDIAMYLTGMSGDSYYYAYDARTFNKLVLGAAKELEGAFIYLYAMSTNINAALQFINDGKDEPFALMSDTDKKLVKTYKGELLFMRAVTYWYLARTWCPPYNDANKNGKYIVYNTTYDTSEERIQHIKDPQLATVETIYNGIVSDLKAAIEILPEAYPADNGSSRMRANKYAAEAMLARVLFYMGADENKTEIKKLLDDVISQDMYDLSEEPYAAFSKIGTGYGKETIWQICYDSSSERFDRNPGIFNYYAYNTGLYDDGSPKCSGYIAFAMSFAGLIQVGWENQYLHVTDAAKADKRFQQLYKKCDDPSSVYYKGAQQLKESLGVVPDFVFLWKYFRGSTQNAKAERRANRPLIRLADMVLMRAQINLMLGDAPGALADVNAVRERAGLSPLQTVTEKDIENERIKEMAGENADRMNWLIGLRKDIPIGNRDASKFQPIKYPYSDYYYQVPVLEQQTNEAYKTK